MSHTIRFSLRFFFYDKKISFAVSCNVYRGQLQPLIGHVVSRRRLYAGKLQVQVQQRVLHQLFFQGVPVNCMYVLQLQMLKTEFTTLQYVDTCMPGFILIDGMID